MPNFHHLLTTSVNDMPLINSPLTLKLFAMVNNDAWLENSSLEGGHLADAASLLLAVIQHLEADEPSIHSLQKLKDILQQIQKHDKDIQTVIADGHTLKPAGNPKQASTTTAPANSLRGRRFDSFAQETPELTYESREAMIRTLASTFTETIKTLSSGESFWIPGGFYAHAMIYELKRIDDNTLVLLVYNTGAGLTYHETKTQIAHGIVKDKRLPILAYSLPFNKVATPEFTAYLTELLKTKIASAWTSHPSETPLLAYPRTAQDLYQKILPLVVHIEGHPINPHKIYPHTAFITGQRSGKCSEAVFHPILRTAFADETLYQRFTLVYRKATIAAFMTSADFTNPMAIRQLNLAVAHLAERAYKHSAFLTAEEFTAITAFTRDLLTQINAPLSASANLYPLLTATEQRVDPIVPTPLPLQNLVSQTCRLITLSATGAVPVTSYVPIIFDDSDASDVQNLGDLFKKMQSMQDKIICAQTKPEISPKEIVVAIEQLFFTYPMSLLHQPCDATQHEQLALYIQSLMSLYWKFYLQQFGINATIPNQTRLLTARQVVAVSAALALLTTVNDQTAFTTAMQIFFMQGASKALRKNTHNPFLTSMNLICDQRLEALTTLQDTYTPHINTDLLAIYAAVIMADESQKHLLLEIFSTHVLTDKEKFKLNVADAHSLNTENKKCLFVLLTAYSKLPPETQKQLTPSRERTTKLNHCYQIFNICGSMISHSPSIPQQLDLSFNPQDLIHTMELTSYWERNDTINWRITGLDNAMKHETISSDLQKAHPPIQQNQLSKFLRLDINNARSDHVNRYGVDSFSSSDIQAESATHPPVLTEQEFLFCQFCHTRTAVSCQITATLEFFQAHPELLNQPDWQTIATLNLLQPSVLLEAIDRHPALQETCQLFLKKLFTMNSNKGLPNPVGLFCIRLQAMINIYLIDSTGAICQQATKHLQQVYDNLEILLKEPLNTSLQRELYHGQCHVITALIKSTHDETKQRAFLQTYLTAKLLGSTLSVLNLTTTPDAFILNEVDMVSMKAFLITHEQWVKDIILDFVNLHFPLSSLNQKRNRTFQYPSVFLLLPDEEDDSRQMMGAINVETGQVLKNGKEYALLPAVLLASPIFQALAGPTVKGWIAMAPKSAVPTLFEIPFSPELGEKNTNTLFINNTAHGFVFQQDFLMVDDSIERCQLTSSAELGNLHTILPSTLFDTQHRFWATIAAPQQVIIQDSNTNAILYHIGPSQTDTSLVHITPYHHDFDRPIRSKYVEDYQLLSKNDVKKSDISQILGNVEDSEFISVETYTGNDPTKPHLLITLARYDLKFAVTNTTPLTIESLTEPKGTLVLDPRIQQHIQLKNVLFIQTDKHLVALLPRQYFIDDNKPDPERFEYTRLCLDTTHKHAALVLHTKKTDLTLYCNQSEWIAVPITEENGHHILRPTDSASALYVAYTYLANGDPYTALALLKYWEQQGGLKGTQREFEHLMLFFMGLPATSIPFEAVREKMIHNPTFIAVRTFTLYLYAKRLHQELLPAVDITSAKQDARCFLQDTTEFSTKFMSTLDQTLTQYFTGKHNIPVFMQLNAQQESTCLRMSPRHSLLGITYTHLQTQAFVTPTHENNPDITIQNGCTYNITQLIPLQKLAAQPNQDEITKFSQLIAAPTLQNHIFSKEYANELEFEKELTTPKLIQTASEQLSLALPSDDFFKHFLVSSPYHRVSAA